MNQKKMKRARGHPDGESSSQEFFDVIDEKTTIVAPRGVLQHVLRFILTKFSWGQRFDCVRRLYHTCKTLRTNKLVCFILSTPPFSSRYGERMRLILDDFYPGVNSIEPSWFIRLDWFHEYLHLFDDILTPTSLYLKSPSWIEEHWSNPSLKMHFPYVTTGSAKMVLPVDAFSLEPSHWVLSVVFWQAPCFASAAAFILTTAGVHKFAIKLPGRIWLLRRDLGDDDLEIYSTGHCLQKRPMIDMLGYLFAMTPYYDTFQEAKKLEGTDEEKLFFFVNRWFSIPSESQLINT